MCVCGFLNVIAMKNCFSIFCVRALVKPLSIKETDASLKQLDFLYKKFRLIMNGNKYIANKIL